MTGQRRAAKAPSCRDRVRGLATLPAARVEPTVGNWRTHDAGQKARMVGLFGDVGSVAALVAWIPDDTAREALRRLPGPDGFAAWLASFSGSVRLVDGHMRRGLLGRSMAVQITDLDAREAALVLATFDPVGALAGRDDALLRELLAGQASTQDGAEALLADLRTLLGEAAAPGPDLDDGPPVDPTDELLAKWSALGCVAGSLWEIPSADGARVHRVLCGDARKPGDVERLLDGRKINVAFTSPPYASQRKYDPASGFRPIPPAKYVEWFEPVQANVRSVLASDGSWFVNIKPAADGLDTELYVLDLVLAHARSWGWHFATELCWSRSGMPKSVKQRFKNCFEPVYQFAVARWKMRPEAVVHASESIPQARGKGAGNTGWGGAGKITQGTRDVFAENDRARGMAYPGNMISTGKNNEPNGHAAAFPVALPAFFARAYSDPLDAIFDPFLGSGTTVLAAERTGRVGYGTELAARYVAVTLERLTRAGLTPGLCS